MTDETIAERYRRRAQLFTETVAAVPEEAWNRPSPCPDWKTIDVVRHVTETQGMFAGFVGRQMQPGPAVDEDALEAWKVARDQTQEALDTPDMAAQEFDGFMGPQRFEVAVDRFLSFDLVVHRWDLARAAGLPDQIPEVDIDALQAAVDTMSEQMGDAMRGPGAFGPELEPPAGADQQTRLLAFLGRRA